MHVRRASFVVVRLLDGTVLVAGGLVRNGEVSSEGSFTIHCCVMQWFVVTGVIMAGANGLKAPNESTSTMERRRLSAPCAARFKVADATAPLSEGRVLVAGGDSRAEVFDAATDRFAVVPGSLGGARNLGASVALRDGTVLIAGGYDSLDPLPTTETAIVYRP